MKKLFIFVLCLFFVTGSAQAGAGGNSAKQDGRLWQAGESSIFFYDVPAEADAHGFGRLVIDIDKHTFVFVGKDFKPSTLIDLKYRAQSSDDYVLFATGKTTPSGNLHIAGTWSRDTAPNDVSAGLVTITNAGWITGFDLQNEGWFVAKVACYYSTDGTTWTESDHTDGLKRGEYIRFWLDDYDIPHEAWVRIHVIVVGGNDKTGAVFTYFNTYGSNLAQYTIDGTTLNATLHYEGCLQYPATCDPAD